MKTLPRRSSRVLLAAALALAATGAMAAGYGPRDPYGVPPGGTLILDKRVTRVEKASICRHEAAYRHLGEQFIRNCEAS